MLGGELEDRARAARRRQSNFCARGCSLMPRAPGVEAAARLLERRLVQIEAQERDQTPVRALGERERAVVRAPRTRMPVRLVERYPEATLIIAHAGIADLAAARRAPRRAERRALRHVDWSPVVCSTTTPGAAGAGGLRVATPYGQQPAFDPHRAEDRTASPGSMTTRCAAMLGGTANAPADGGALPEPTAAGRRGPLLEQPMQLARIHQYLSMAMPLLWMRQPDTRRRARASRSTRARSGTAHAEELDGIRELLMAASDLWATLPQIEDEVDRAQRQGSRFD